MKFNITALALTAGVIWGGAMLVVTSANLIWPSYGQTFLDLIASIYPGFRPGSGVSSVIVGTIYGLVSNWGRNFRLAVQFICKKIVSE